MKLLHLTPKKHYNSIMKNGLLPSKVKLESHVEAFQDAGLEGDKCVYLWEPDKSCCTNKVIEDFIYCKHFIHPRNQMFDDRMKLNDELWDKGLIEDWDDFDKYIDFTKLGSKLYGDEEDFVLFEIDSKYIDLLDSEYYHTQGPDDGKTSTTNIMNPKYAHDDKVLQISKDKIDSKHLKLIAEVSTRIYKNDTIGTTYKKLRV